MQVFLSSFEPLEYTVPHRKDECFAKLVCIKSENMRVAGFHVLGPNAGEITQGFAIGVRMRATKADFDALVGIHPTCAEVSREGCCRGRGRQKSKEIMRDDI